MPQLSMQYSTFQSTLSVRRATDEVFDDFFSLLISIHALRKESDHTTCIGSLRYFPFQSTLSVRRATARVSGEQGARRISIHALRKESDAAVSAVLVDECISIHALRKESDRDRLHLEIHPT